MHRVVRQEDLIPVTYRHINVDADEVNEDNDSGSDIAEDDAGKQGYQNG